jgi:hypothetical protein
MGFHEWKRGGDMVKIVLSILFILFATPLLAADKSQQENVPVFTDQDLERYTKPSKETESLEEPQPVRDDTDLKGNTPVDREGRLKLKRQEVPYKAYEGSAKRIIIPITLNASVTAPILLDTGATGMLISFGLAEKTGILEKDEGNLLESVSGIAGSIPAILTIVDTIRVGGLEEHFIPTKVSQPFSNEFEGLIGMDFVSNYSVQIDTRKQVVVFEELSPMADMPGGHDESWWRNIFHQFASKRAEWRKLKESLNDIKDPSQPAMTVRTGRRARAVTVGELKTFADRQYEEADKLLHKLDRYAIRNAVPMGWREY